MTTAPKPGIYHGVPFDEYRSWDAVNHHTLWRLREESPAHARYEQLNGTDETEALAFGSLTDFVLLEPARFAEQAVVEPEIGEGLAPRRPTKRQIEAKKPSPATIDAIHFWEDWDAANAGKIVVKAADYAKVQEIAAQVRVTQCREFICSGESQVCLVWQDVATGLLCKARLDYARYAGFHHIITDLKTSRSAKDGFWQWAIHEYGYFQQMAWYHDGWKILTGEDSLCIWLVAEKKGPWLVEPIEMKKKTLRAGRISYRAALDRYAQCLKANEWPGYGGLRALDMTDWALQLEGVNPLDPEDQE